MLDPVQDLLDLQKAYLESSQYDKAGKLCVPLLQLLTSARLEQEDLLKHQVSFNNNVKRLEEDKKLLTRRLSKLLY